MTSLAKREDRIHPFWTRRIPRWFQGDLLIRGFQREITASRFSMGAEVGVDVFLKGSLLSIHRDDGMTCVLPNGHAWEMPVWRLQSYSRQGIRAGMYGSVE